MGAGCVISALGMFSPTDNPRFVAILVGDTVERTCGFCDRDTFTEWLSLVFLFSADAVVVALSSLCIRVKSSRSDLVATIPRIRDCG